MLLLRGDPACETGQWRGARLLEVAVVRLLWVWAVLAELQSDPLVEINESMCIAGNKPDGEMGCTLHRLRELPDETY